MKTNDDRIALLATLATALDAARSASGRASLLVDHGSAAALASAVDAEARAEAALDAARLAAIPALVAELLAAVGSAATAAAKARDHVDAPMPSAALEHALGEAGDDLPDVARTCTRAVCDIVLALELRAE